jgi:uncharacterized protein YcnI
MNMKKWIGTFTMTGALLLFAGNASAHVTVWPKEATAGSYEKYTVRVPVEKDINTTKVRVEFPKGVKVGSVMPVPGWKYEFEKNAEGTFTGITWTATAGGIKPHEFMEFSFSGKNPKEPGQIAWKAYQTYADNSVVEWTGAEGSETPASITTLKQGTGTDAHQHGDAKGEHETHEAPKEEAAPPAQQEKPETSSASTSNTLPLVLSGLALLLSVISLFRKKSTK